jgi:D-alanine transaminase
MQAKKQGADDAWLVEDGLVTEGTSNNVWIVTKEGKLVTRQLSQDILHGITRASVLRYAKEAQMQVEERNFTIEEAQQADEAFVTSASAFVTTVVEIDGAKIGSGTPGKLAPRLREICPLIAIVFVVLVRDEIYFAIWFREEGLDVAHSSHSLRG